MHSIRIALPILSLAIAAASYAQDTTPPGAASAKHSLRIGAKKGDRARFRCTQTSTQAFDVSGQQMESGSESTKELELVVLDVDDKGELTVEVKFASIKGKSTIPMMGDIEFDSTAKDEGDADDGNGMIPTGQIKKSFLALAGKTAKAKVSATGDKVTIENAKELFPNEPRRMRGMMGGGGGDASSLKDELQNLFARYPTEDVGVGTTWGRQDNSSRQGAPFVIDLKQKLGSIDATQVLIESEGTVTSPKAADSKPSETADPAGEEQPGAAQMREMLRSMKIDKGKVRAKTQVARKDGLVNKHESEMSMAVTMEGPMGEMTIDMKNKVVVERVAEGGKKDAEKK